MKPQLKEGLPFELGFFFAFRKIIYLADLTDIRLFVHYTYRLVRVSSMRNVSL